VGYSIPNLIEGGGYSRGAVILFHKNGFNLYNFGSKKCLITVFGESYLLEIQILFCYFGQDRRVDTQDKPPEFSGGPRRETTKLRGNPE